MHRFFLTEAPIHPQQSVDLSPFARQLRLVLRLRPGDRIVLLDGAGYAYPTEIRHLDRDAATGSVLERHRVETEPLAHLTLYQCALKADKFEWVLQKGTEIGVSRFVPVISSRTIVRPAQKIAKKYERWRAIIREAAEQSGRGRLPVLGDPLDWTEAVVQAEGLRLLPWEESTAAGGVGGMGEVLEKASHDQPVALLIGPEGGISPDEAREAAGQGWSTVSLGPRILRAETAAIVASALVLHHLGRLG